MAKDKEKKAPKQSTQGLLLIFLLINFATLAIGFAAMFLLGALTPDKVSQIIHVLRKDPAPPPKLLTEREVDLGKKVSAHQDQAKRFASARKKAVLDLQANRSMLKITMEDLLRQKDEMKAQLDQINKDKAEWEARQEAATAGAKKKKIENLVKTFLAMEPDNVTQVVMAGRTDKANQVFIPNFENGEIMELLLAFPGDFRAEIIASLLNNPASVQRGADIVRLINKKKITRE